jgi:hypothetical protein
MHSGGNNEEDKMQKADEMKEKSQAYNFNPGSCDDASS